MVRLRPASLAADERGQAVTEYVLLLALSVSLAVIVAKGLTKMQLGQKLSKPLTEDFARVYQYGHPEAKGFDDGGPEMHPRAYGGNNGRMFINPEGL